MGSMSNQKRGTMQRVWGRIETAIPVISVAG